jgi:UDP-glucose 4-epimerase
VTSATDLSRSCALVLGARGFIGSHLTDALLAAGAHVRAFDREAIRPVLDSTVAHANLENIDGDFTSAADLDRALQGVDICFHLVSTTLPRSSNLDTVYDAETNLVGTLRMIDLALRHGVKRIVFVSSGGTVYGTPRQVPIREDHATDPLCAYGITKLAIEKHLELARVLHGLEYTVLRLANPYGERQRPEASQGAVAVFLGKALKNEAIEVWGDGSVVRDFIYIGDVVAALLAASRGGATEQRVFNIGSGRGNSVTEVLECIGACLGRRPQVHYLPARVFDVPVNVLDIARAREHLAWAPGVDLLAGVSRSAEWLRRKWLGAP